jgi:hypothetical protein
MVTSKTKKKPVAAAEVEAEKRFWLNGGGSLGNLSQLASALEKMDEKVWNHHVTAEKNDFANWVEGVFGDKKLGLAIRKAKGPKAAAKLIKPKGTSKILSFLLY